MAGIAFTKLEALGNDFVLLDARDGRAEPEPQQVRALADRRTGIGFDQLLILQPGATETADCRVRIFNGDGSSARQCGNGMRAIALWLADEQPERDRFVLATDAGPVAVECLGGDRFRAAMGCPDFDPAAVGLDLAGPLDGLVEAVPGWLAAGVVSIGNPHLVILLDRPAAPGLVEQHGLGLATNPHFRHGANVSFAALTEPGRVELRVHERGVGPTRACGSAACAVAAFLIQSGRANSPLHVDQPGGRLVIDWPGQFSPLLMTGPARRVFDGVLP